MFHRADSFGDQALRIATGTIEHDSLSIILVLTSDEEGSPSTGTRPWWPCPHCETHQRWELVDGEGELAQLSYSGDDEEAVRSSARLTCGHCAAMVTEAERQAGIRRMLFPHRGQTVDGGVVVGPSPVTRSLGILWSAADCSLTSLPELAVEHWRAAHQLEASGERGLMRKFVRYRACTAYKAEDQLSRIAPSAIVRRAAGSTYGRGEVPWRHAVVSLAVDQQLRELFWLVSAHLSGQTAVVAWGVEYVCRQYEQPSGQQRRDALSRIVDLCARWAPSVCGVDVGGGGKQTQEGRSWSADTDAWLLSKGWTWWAIRGAQDVLGWSAALEAALDEGESRHAARRAEARKHGWDDRIREIEGLIARAARQPVHSGRTR
jgi:phage terminase large subunit GpA-like protein